MDLHILSRRIKGEVESDLLHRVIYATDASAYREMPLGVVYPERCFGCKGDREICAGK